MPGRDLLFARRCSALGVALLLSRPPPVLVLANGVEDLGEPEIDLPPLEVHANHLHAHLVAEPVDLVRVLAVQRVAAVEIAVVVVGHAGDVHQALDEVLDQLDEQPERRHARDVAVELVADLVGHEPHLAPLQQFPLGVVGAALALGGVPRDLGQFLVDLLAPRLVDPAAAVRAQQTVHDQVGIPANRRGEVRVAGRRQAEMAPVLRGIARLLHGLEHQERHRPLLGRAGDLLDEPLKVPGPQRVERRAERMAEPRDELLELLDLQQVGLFVNAIEPGPALRPRRSRPRSRWPAA